VSAFLALVQLTPAEQALLDDGDSGAASPPRPIVMSAAFFAVLERMQRVRAECRALQSTPHQRVALDVMDEYARRLEGAYDRLRRWLQQHTRAHADPAAAAAATAASRATGNGRAAGDDVLGADIVNPLVTRALLVLLHARPVYFEVRADADKKCRPSTV